MLSGKKTQVLNDETTKNKSPKDINFIVLHDTAMFNDVKIPEGATNYVLWYKKEDPCSWGISIKAFPTQQNEGTFSTQHIWKVSWYHDELQELLAPSKESQQFTECIKGELFNKLNELKNKHYNKLLNKKKKNN
jgi:hypothetical protein